MDAERQAWNKSQSAFRQVLLSFDQPERALPMFHKQHAALHAGEIDPSMDWSFQDEVLEGIAEAQLRRIPDKALHSVAWLLWHMARIEDVAMNVLVADQEQVFSRDH